MNSLNHYAYGSIVEWMYQSICGLQIEEEYPGFKHFVIKPNLCGRLKYAEVVYQSAAGCIKSRWEINGMKMLMNIVVPFDTQATVYLPYPKSETIIGINKQLLQTENDGYQYAELSAGEYQISYDLKWNVGECYSFDYSLNEMIVVPEVAEVLYDLTDKIGIMPKNLVPDPNKPLREAFSEMVPVALEQIREVADLERIEEKLKMIPVRRVMKNVASTNFQQQEVKNESNRTISTI